MADSLIKKVHAVFSGAALAIAFAVAPVTAVKAEDGVDTARTAIISTQNKRTIVGERYIPGIWVDPDGCEHWVMDDGVEGYMTPHVTRKGIPVCRRGNVCGVLNSDQFFATNKYRISAGGRDRLKEFFQQSTAIGFIIAGHTDSRASDEYNMRLSYNRANAVAAVGKSVGAKIIDVRGYGERMPAATNGTTEGMAKNRRVEIICIQ
ncbi:OmpA family protein [Thalassococcus halodurans]|uniref:OmpA family protein n=1 Tax=Thalassococcus halodurans TaxID=373675 RepID=A0A1H5T8X3_9RHOB|nr:OmpA family protein [Thalassococcus halodurans]